jgi:HSP20 family protein
MTDDRATQTRGDNANTDQHSSASTGGGSTSSGSGAQSSRSPGASTTGDRQQSASTTGDRQRSIQTSNEQSRGANQQSRGANEQSRGMGLTRGQQSTPGAYGTTGSPFSLMRRMAEDMDRLFEDFGLGVPGFALSPSLSSQPMQRRGGSGNVFQRTGWIPQIETFRRGDNLVLRADLPGMRKEDVSVEIDDGILTISGERSNEDVDDREGYYHSERSYGQFQRSLALPEGLTGDNCDATFKDGVLEVTIPMPKQAEKSARKVQIR